MAGFTTDLRLAATTLFILPALAVAEARAQFSAKWLDVGDFHHGITQIGHRHEGGGRGWYFPAIRHLTHHTRAEAFWIGVRNWTDAEGEFWPYYTARIGPARSGADVAFPVAQKLVSRWEPGRTNVDDVASYLRKNPANEIDPDLPADRMVETTWNMDVGITVRMRAYAFGNAYHDNYHIVDYLFTNTGRAGGRGDVEFPGQFLQDVFLFWVHRWLGGPDQAARVGDGAQQWGRYTMLDVVGDGHAEYPVDFTAYYAWHGREPNFSAANWDNLGGPLIHQCCSALPGDSVGRLAGGDFDGEMVLYAPNSTVDPTYDPMVQPYTIGYYNEEPWGVQSHEHAYRDFILTRHRQTRTPEVSPARMWPHLADLIEPEGRFWAPTRDPSQGRQGGFAQAVAFGPYDMAFGDSVRIVVARGIGSLSWDAQLEIGRAYKLSGADDAAVIEYDANGDGQITCIPWDYSTVFDGNECLTKNQWVMTVRDSLFQTFYRAREVFERSNDFSEYAVPEPPHPPVRFDVFARPEHVELRWQPPLGGPARTGWEVYRTYDRPEWSPQIDGIRLGEAAPPAQRLYRRVDDRLPYTCLRGDRPGCLGPALPPEASAFDDGDVVRETDYYYYVVAVGEPQPVDSMALTGTPSGGPLRSSRYATQTYHPARLSRPPYGATGTVADARVVPNPVIAGAHESIRFGREDEVAFFNVPGEAVITIYTEIGERIISLRHTDGSGDATWDLTTSSRQPVVSGIYVAVIEDVRTGERVFRKFTVIR